MVGAKQHQPVFLRFFQKYCYCDNNAQPKTPTVRRSAPRSATTGSGQARSITQGEHATHTASLARVEGSPPAAPRRLRLRRRPPKARPQLRRLGLGFLLSIQKMRESFI